MQTISPARSILKRCKFQLPELIVDTMPCTVLEIGENSTQNLRYTIKSIPINLTHARLQTPTNTNSRPVWSFLATWQLSRQTQTTCSSGSSLSWPKFSSLSWTFWTSLQTVDSWAVQPVQAYSAVLQIALHFRLGTWPFVAVIIFIIKGRGVLDSINHFASHERDIYLNHHKSGKKARQSAAVSPLWDGSYGLQ